MGDSYYERAVICNNGHVISTYASASPAHYAPFRQTCGAPTVQACIHCKSPIWGSYVVQGVIGFGSKYSAPCCCYQCGKMYPWTEATLIAAGALADELDQLDDEEKELLKRSLDDIIRDTPQAQVGALRFKRLVGKAGGGSAELFKELLKTAVSETMVKILFTDDDLYCIGRSEN